MNPEEKLNALGIELPQPYQPLGNYVRYVKTGNLIHIGGHGPCDDEVKGKVGRDVSMEEAYLEARKTAISLLATLKEAIGDLSKVKRIVKVHGMVNAEDTFDNHPKVINGCSDLLVEVFGEKGIHTRAAVGMSSLPGNIAVEIEMIVEI
ncbi:RidA family protein [Leptobacterium flavescens]|uniref:RidA family protein n=1 Tax=Leptobacterium flavescens TaxID=472055 RepID=A0A6P0UN94_9FLAO|nr:RidA family protein [Leptobacterium flavescens]NER13319.1 RidA family protein [Leptobacterium flavescens]